MKRAKIYILIIFLFFLSSNKLYSQKYVQGGLIGGGNLTSLTGPQKPVNINKGYGFTGGAFLNINVLIRTIII